MKIVMGSEELLSEGFLAFDDLLSGYQADEAQRGRPPTLHVLDVLLIGIALWLLDKAVDKVLDKVMDKSIDWVSENSKREEKLREEKEAARRHEELIQELRSIRDAISEVRSEAYGMGNLDNLPPKLLQMPQASTQLKITLSTAAENDLVGAFRLISRYIPLEVTSSQPVDRTINTKSIEQSRSPKDKA
jgi:hypothetical protein